MTELASVGEDNGQRMRLRYHDAQMHRYEHELDFFHLALISDSFVTSTAITIAVNFAQAKCCPVFGEQTFGCLPAIKTSPVRVLGVPLPA